MSADILEIAFNHDPLGGTSPAVTVRHDALRPAAVPEWQRGLGPAQRSVVCYARDGAGSGPVSIRARFARRRPDVDRVEVRARPLVAPEAPPVWPFPVNPFLLPPEVRAYWSAVAAFLWFSGISPGTPAESTSVLGEVEPTEIAFGANGLSDFVPLRLTADLHDTPVGVYPVRWGWQCRRVSHSDWSDIGVTAHTVYVTLAAPTLPWVQAPVHPANIALPWIDVLDLACRWAAGARTLDQAAERVTRAVNALGGRVVDYDCVGPGAALLGSPHYTVVPGVFDCSAFIERVRGGVGNGRFVNCTDCAAIVGTFANVLGCDLWQSKMGGVVAFPLNPTRAIGSGVWLSACAVGAFAVHEVAWKGQCREDDEVYDACLELDADRDPTRAPHLPGLPVNVPFGRPGSGQYRDRLVAPIGRHLCQPLPVTRQRRIVV